jgi:FAD/FMN-containing dehydrogenase
MSANNLTLSWGRTFKCNCVDFKAPTWSDEISFVPGNNFLPYGQGRSYGDCCLNSKGILFSTSGLNRFISFDLETGIIECEAGVTLSQLHEFSVPKGWFIPVTPGTQTVSIGGAIANDVHGKNHHVSGTFGRYVLEFDLLRSDGQKLKCSPNFNKELFSATISGLGLTGVILSAKIQLKKIASSFLECENIPFDDISEFLEISSKYSQEYEYSVAWLDCASKNSKFGRGVLMCGNHTDLKGSDFKNKSIKVPIDAPKWFLNSMLVKRFNDFYFYWNGKKKGKFLSHFEPFFYPLDVSPNWNRLYGKEGFFQFQCVLPFTNNNEALKTMLNFLKQSEFSSYLVVLKEFGDILSPGMMSFPRAGMTLCLDFPNTGKNMHDFIRSLNALAIDFGGALYPAKDALMTKKEFLFSYPKIEEFKKYIDLAFTSDFWQRVA